MELPVNKVSVQMSMSCCGGDRLTIGSFDKSIGDVCTGRRVLGLLPQLLGETSTTTNEKRHCRLAWRKNIKCVARQTLFVVQIVLFFAPSQGEWMTSPPANVGDVEKDVLAWIEVPWSGNVQSDLDSVARQGLDLDLSRVTSKVVADDHDESDKALHCPQTDSSTQQCLLREVLQVHPCRSCNGDAENEVHAEKGFVKGMTDDRRAVEKDQNQCEDGDKASADERTSRHRFGHHVPVGVLHLVDGPG